MDKDPTHTAAGGTSALLAFLAMVAVGGWMTATAMALEVQGTAVAVMVALPAAALGGLVYWLAFRHFGAQQQAWRALSRALRDAAVRPRDHIAVLKARPPARTWRARDTYHDVSEALALLLDRIERRHARQTAWIAAVVHDVKTPIAASANALTMIARGSSLADSPDREMVVQVASELRSLVADVQRMLDAVRFERDDIEVERTVIDLADVMRLIVGRIVRRGEVTVELRGSGTAIGDPVLVDRALENLVTNAVRYAKSRVTIEVFPGLVRVADDGQGLPAPLEHLTQPFRSEPIEVAGVLVAGGAGGIGLFLARRVLELLGGKLVVESTSSRGTVLLAYVGAANGS